MGFLPRVEALLASTLGYEIATPTELLLLAGHNSSLMMRVQGLYIIGLLSMMCASTTIYGYPFVDDAPPGLCMISPLAMMCAFTAMSVYPIVDEVLPKSYALLVRCR